MQEWAGILLVLVGSHKAEHLVLGRDIQEQQTLVSPGPDMAKKAKARTIIVKLLSTAGTGFFYTTRRPRTTPKLSFMKFDPRANQNVLFNEAKINRPN
ncbi:hypothetical protein BGX23_005089 [Mortierella sp. AD031]|nr:hypothetical protein BGX23_005089 [Mortierella sp. AD031]KAG0208854.1 hypothetical protein BGX33_006000 [Mortierella sp. NVP41]